MGRAVTVFLIGVFLAAFGFWLYNAKGGSLVAPVPRVFGASQYDDKIRNDWFPKQNTEKLLGDIKVNANSAILVDYDTGAILHRKDAHKRQPVASTVKIMTALMALKYTKLTDVFTVSESAAKVGENSMILTAGEKLTLEELLYGMMLVSGNDAAVAIAQNIAGDEDKFVEMMNRTAQDLGLKDTRFVNASGLDDDYKTQYSTAYDMAVIAHYLWENYPKIREITSTYHKYIEDTDDHKDFELYNDTNLLTTYPGVRGIKPGFTWESGLCLVTYAENGGKKLIGIILGSGDRRGEMKELLDFGFAQYGITVNHPALDF